MERKTFAFKLAGKTPTSTSKWRTRDGVSVAGCTDVTGDGDFRFKLRLGDHGDYC